MATLINNRYQLQDKLGAGGMGTVYKAYDRLTQTEVALKRVETQTGDLLFNSQSLSSDEHVAIIQEFSILASLRHPNIISVLDYGLADDQPFFTMELVPQGDNFTESTQDLSDFKQIKLMIQLLEALRYLHRRGVIHRDLKPDNILVLEDHQVKVLDFGLSVNKAIARGRAGTIAYMSPETMKSQIALPQSDLYAVGVLAYQMITDELPFAPDDIMGIVTRKADMSKLGDHPAANVIERLLLKDPDERYSSADTCIRAVQKAFAMPTEDESETVRESFLQASKFVGRDGEIKTLEDELKQVRRGSTSFYLIGGDSGVGKSRLLDEFRIHALVSGATVLHGQAIEGGGLPFQLWRNIVRHLLLTVDVTDFQASIFKDIVPDIDDLIGCKVEKVPDLKGYAYQQRLVLAIVDLLQNVTQPLVLLMEDLQWTNEGFETLKHLHMTRGQYSHLMVVLTYRNDEMPTLPKVLSSIPVMSLERIDTMAVQELIESMLGDTAAQEKVVDLVEKETEGNIFFIVETVRVLAENFGHLSNVGKTTLPQSVFTRGMNQLMQRRLNKMDEQYQAIQRLAAVIGREIDIALLTSNYEYKMVESWLTEASEHAVLGVYENRWRFAHDKLRETITATTTDVEKKSLHRVAAQAIEAVYPDTEDYNHVLLEHWHRAGDLDKEIHYLNSVAEDLVTVKADYEHARVLLERGLQQLPRDHTQHISLWNWAALSYERQANYDPAQVLAQQSRELAQRNDNQPSIAVSLYILGRVAYGQGDYEQARTYHQQSLAIRQTIGDQHGIANNLNMLGTVASDQGNYEQAQGYHQQSLAIYRAIGDQHGIADSLTQLGIVASRQSNYKLAQGYHQQSLAIYRAIGNQLGIADSLNHLGLVVYRQRNYEEARNYFQQSLAMQQAIGNQLGVANSLTNLGLVAHHQRNYEEARKYFQQGLAISQTIGYQYGIANSLTNLGFAYLRMQDGRTTGTFHEALTIAQSVQLTPIILEVLVGFAWLRLQQSDPTRATHLVGLSQHHPATDRDVQLRLNELLPQLKKALSADDLQVAIGQGAALDFATVVREILNDFSRNDT